MSNFFKNCTSETINNNPHLREPQLQAYLSLVDFYNNNSNHREAGIVLPVGCGKSGCITLTPFAFKSSRTLVIAPNLNIAKQLNEEFDPAHDRFFYKKCTILNTGTYPEPVEIRGTKFNLHDLNEADVVITNIQQLQGDNNRWLNQLSSDFFDLIVFDEGHHTVAESWTRLKEKFTNAKIVNFSATPLRADGQMMAGEIIYSYPIFKAINNGYVKQLTGLILQPDTLKYVRNDDGQEIEVSLDEVVRLGEDDADFRRSIVTSKETLDTIVDASIRALEKLRKEANDDKLKIIGSALNMQHCIQIVEAYRARGKRAEYVHSKTDGNANDVVMQKLNNHQIDVIIQVRKLGEGFDHPYLAVAAVFSIFSNLSPFVQFVGRIMRIIAQNDISNPINRGIVVFHAGANIAQRWSDFQKYSEADQSYFEQLLPLLDSNSFMDQSEISLQPNEHNQSDLPISEYGEIRSQSIIKLEEIPLISDDLLYRKLKELGAAGFDSAEQLIKDLNLEPVPVTKARYRHAKRMSLDETVKQHVGRILSQHNLNPEGHDLDSKHLGRSNFVIIKSTIDKKINNLVGCKTKERDKLSSSDLDKIESNFLQIISDIEMELFSG